MREKGFHLSLEALFSLCLLLSLLSLSVSPKPPSLYQLAVMQKQHDLLKAWHVGKTFSLEEMAADFEKVFPSLSGKIILRHEGEEPQEKTIGEWVEEGKRENYYAQGSIYAEGKFHFIEVAVQAG